jgi:hypothetical protein
MMHPIATDRPGAIRARSFGVRKTWLPLVAALVGLNIFVLTAGAAAAEPAITSGEEPAVGDRDQTANLPPSPQSALAAKQVVAYKIGDAPIRRIGPVTTVTEVSTGLPFRARVDTGATTCSIHYEAIEIEDAAASPEENVGKPVRILVKNPDGKSRWIDTKIADHVVVRTSTDEDERYKVRLKLRWEDVEKKVLVTLSDREKMKYPVLLGRNFLRGDFLVDVNLDVNLDIEK